MGRGRRISTTTQPSLTKMSFYQHKAWHKISSSSSSEVTITIIIIIITIIIITIWSHHHLPWRSSSEVTILMTISTIIIIGSSSWRLAQKRRHTWAQAQAQAQAQALTWQTDVDKAEDGPDDPQQARDEEEVEEGFAGHSHGQEAPHHVQGGAFPHHKEGQDAPHPCKRHSHNNSEEGGTQ